jgi:hypothetical protein
MGLRGFDSEAGGGQAAIDQVGPVLDLLQLTLDEAEQACSGRRRRSWPWTAWSVTRCLQSVCRREHMAENKRKQGGDAATQRTKGARGRGIVVRRGRPRPGLSARVDRIVQSGTGDRAPRQLSGWTAWAVRPGTHA